MRKEIKDYTEQEIEQFEVQLKDFTKTRKTFVISGAIVGFLSLMGIVIGSIFLGIFVAEHAGGSATQEEIMRQASGFTITIMLSVFGFMAGIALIGVGIGAYTARINSRTRIINEYRNLMR